MTEKMLVALIILAACNADEVHPPNVPDTDTDGGYGETGDTEDNPSECWDYEAPADAVRWQCEGVAAAALFATLDVEVPDWIDDTGLLQSVVDQGRFDFHELFGPWNHESYDDPGIDACCLPSIAGAEEVGDEGADETGADAQADPYIPQVALACAYDCVDQACRQAPEILRDLAREIPAGVPVFGPSYREQIRALANWIATNHGACYDALRTDSIKKEPGGYRLGGEWSIPDSDQWPVVTEISIDGHCKIFDWFLPEVGEPHACTGINDNNDEEPFGSGGSSLGGFDTFAPTGGELWLDGPTIYGIHAAGSAPILGLGEACPRGECSRVDAWVTGDTLELRRLLLVAPPVMVWEQDGMELVVEGLHALIEHPRSIPLEGKGEVMHFEIAPDRLELLLSGRIHGVPLEVAVPNATPLVGTVTPLPDGSHGLTLEPFVVEHHDDHGTWTLGVVLGDLIALDHSPRATFAASEAAGAVAFDASMSLDPDGDPLIFEWFLDGVLVGEGPVVVPELSPGLSTLAVRVSDESGRSSWSYGLGAHEE